MDTTVPNAEPAATTRRMAASVAASHDLTALSLIAALLVCAALAVWVGRPLYADGANYLLHLLIDPELFSEAWTRRGAHLITQVPVILAIRAGFSDVTLLARIYGASLYATPLLAYGATTWLSRRDPVLSIGNAVIVIACFYPTSMFIVGEFQVLYALFWCGFVLLITGRADRPVVSAIVLALVLGIAVSYEISVLACPLMMLACLWRANRTDSRPAHCILILTTVPLVAGIVIGALGILLPRDPTNSGQFLHVLLRSYQNGTLLGLSGLLALAAAASLLQGSLRRRATVMTIAVACVGLGWELTWRNHRLDFGDSYSERAQVVPIIMGVAAACGLDARWRARAAIVRRWRFVSWPLLLPALMVVALDVNASLGWRGFLDRFCSVLTDETASSAVFLSSAAAQTFGWRWTYPTLSVLLRPAGSVAMVRNPDPQQWQPFNPDRTPDLDRYKTRGGMCRLDRDAR